MICIDVYEAPMALPKAQSPQSSATIGFEAKLWLTADKLRNNMDAAEYKHVVSASTARKATPPPAALP